MRGFFLFVFGVLGFFLPKYSCRHLQVVTAETDSCLSCSCCRFAARICLWMHISVRRPPRADMAAEGRLQTLNVFSCSHFRPALTFLEHGENKQMFSESQGDLETIN